MGLTGDRNFQNSCEAYALGTNFRVTFYGLTREEVVSRPEFLLPRVGFPDSYLPADWQDHVVVTATKRIRLGLGVGWARGSRRRNEYGDPE